MRHYSGSIGIPCGLDPKDLSIEVTTVLRHVQCPQCIQIVMTKYPEIVARDGVPQAPQAPAPGATAPQPKIGRQPTNAEEEARVSAAGALLTRLVAALIQAPNPKIAALARHVWDLFGSRTTQQVLHERIPSPTFVALKHRDTGAAVGMVLIPSDWVESTAKDPSMSLCAVVHVGSHAVDVYNGKLLTPADFVAAAARASAYEASFLEMQQREVPSWRPNDYQRIIMSKWPGGIDGLKARDQDLYYVSKATPTQTD